MAEPEQIAKFIAVFLEKQTKTNGKRICITAGPTQEAIDPVRYISNHSSGKMGFAIAKAALIRGYEVDLISGPSKEILEHPHLNRIDVITAEDMLSEVKKYWHQSSIGVFTAAVADFKPQNTAKIKLKKREGIETIMLEQNPDILKWASSNKNKVQKVIGFALETNNEEENALIKLKQKNLDLIVLNSTKDEGATFGGEQNKVTVFGKAGMLETFELQGKFKIAIQLIDLIEGLDA
jgi:phosphopantothenoylcysteine decarboxylase/phosphopantothenate--cysteine ligase